MSERPGLPSLWAAAIIAHGVGGSRFQPRRLWELLLGLVSPAAMWRRLTPEMSWGPTSTTAVDMRPGTASGRPRNLFNRFLGQLFYCLQTRKPVDETKAFIPAATGPAGLSPAGQK